ncbi:hypothetical protein BA6E_11338 [Bacteroidales bacterium 6E]|jgi:hypothetical protein|nr:hypothetical protein BA6E_11338 [Bacteroidales bacterium 6E]
MKTVMQIMFLFLALRVALFVSGQEPVSLTRDDLISGIVRGIFISIDLINAVLARKSVNLFLHQLSYPVEKEFKNDRGIKTSHPRAQTK